jgi:hypothetical protein
MRRTQLYLDEECGRTLTAGCRRRRTTISALVREAISRAYGSGSAKDRATVIDRLAGIWRGRTDLGNADRVVRKLRVELDERVGRKAGSYRLRFGSSHGVEIADALIAAAAHVHDLTLCTRNLRHYPMRDIRKRRV